MFEIVEFDLTDEDLLIGPNKFDTAQMAATVDWVENSDQSWESWDAHVGVIAQITHKKLEHVISMRKHGECRIDGCLCKD